jgi:hypothetical protein
MSQKSQFTKEELSQELVEISHNLIQVNQELAYYRMVRREGGYIHPGRFEDALAHQKSLRTWKRSLQGSLKKF